MSEQIQKIIISYFFLSYLIFAFACFNLINSLTIILSFFFITSLFVVTKNTQWDIYEQLTSKDIKIFVAIILFIFMPLAHIFIIPPYLRDDIIYHLLVPKIVMSSGGLVIDPYNINTNFPMAFEMPLILFQIPDLSLSPFLINYFVLILMCFIYYDLAVKCFKIKSELAALSVMMIATTPIIYDLVHSCYVELFLFLILIAFTNYIKFNLMKTGIRLFTGI